MPNQQKNQSVLIISYYWPPSGGPGVQRWLKMAKYLSLNNFDVHVLAPLAEKANYPIKDISLLNDIPESITVHYSDNFDVFNLIQKVKPKTEYPYSGFANQKKIKLSQKLLRFTRSHLFIPDPRKGWNKYAIEKANEIIKDFSIQNIITSSPPHSTQLIGLQLKKKHPQINWLADLRDPWTDIFYYHEFYHSSISKKIDLKLEKSVIENSDKILVVGNGMKSLYHKKYPHLAPEKIQVIYNGYDHVDIKSTKTPNPQHYTIGYTGTLANTYKIDFFLSALIELKEYHSILRLQFVGRIDEGYKKMIMNSDLKELATFIDHVPHQEAIDIMHSSDLLLLAIPKHENNELHVSGKIFEYLASKRKVMCIGPKNGDPAIILKETNGGETFDYEEEIEIFQFLKNEFESFTNNKHQFEMSSNPEKFTRENIAKTVATLLN